MIIPPAIGGASAALERLRRAARRTADGAFAALVAGTSAEPSAGAAATAGPVAGLDGLLGIQEVGADQSERRRAAIAYGDDLLDRLEVLRRHILAGRVPGGEVRALAQAMRGNPRRCGEAAIDAVLDAIELRVEVEIAKLCARR